MEDMELTISLASDEPELLWVRLDVEVSKEIFLEVLSSEPCRGEAQEGSGEGSWKGSTNTMSSSARLRLTMSSTSFRGSGA